MSKNNGAAGVDTLAETQGLAEGQGGAELQTVAWAHNTVSKFDCVLCGNDHEQNTAAISLVEGDDNLGDVCPTCAHLGPAGAAARTRAQAQELRGQADYLDALAGRVEGITAWATLEDLARAELEIAAYMEADYPAEAAKVAAWVEANLEGYLKKRTQGVERELEIRAHADREQY
jgi:hypothetical protein